MKTIQWIATILSGAVCVLFFFLGRIPFNEGYNPAVPDIDTRYASDYDEKLSRQIQVGDSITHAFGLLGKPYDEEPTQINDKTYYWYTSDGACLWNDFAWLGRGFITDKEGVIIEIINEVIHD